MNSKFNQAEENERAKFSSLTAILGQWTIKKLSKTGSYAAYDAVINSGGTLSISEIKCRTFNNSKYPTAILETSKVDRITNIISTFSDVISEKYDGLTGHYFSFYEDCTVAFWPITGYTSTGWEMMPATTCGNFKREYTEVYYYPLSAIMTIKSIIKLYSITWDGKLFLEFGGYEHKYELEKKDIKIAKVEKMFLIFVAALGAIYTGLKIYNFFITTPK
jgi:hypothetical protein